MGSVGFVNRKNWLLESFSMLRFSSLTEAIFWQIILGEFILRHTSDVNGSNFSVSRLLCGRGNTCSSKPPKYTFKSHSTRLTSLLTLYQIKIRKLSHQSNSNEMPCASGRGKLNTCTVHSIAYVRAKVYHQRKKRTRKTQTFISVARFVVSFRPWSSATFVCFSISL